MSNKKSFWNFFQSLGRSFMLPIALLAISGILLGIGAAFRGAAIRELMPWIGNPILQQIFNYMFIIGLFTFKNLPVLFGIAIPLGLVKEDKEIAALSGFVGYAVMNVAINFYLTQSGQLADAETMRYQGQSMIMGVQSIETGVLGGIISGIIVYKLHEKFSNIKLPLAFAFFEGVRFVPIITLFTMSLVGIFVIPSIWPVFSGMINGLGHLISVSGAFGAFLLGASERLLIPFGLHHILTALVRFTAIGGEAIINGEPVTGALNIFYQLYAAHEPITSELSRLLVQGRLPSFFFGLPAMALAVYHTAKLENKPFIKGLLISGVVTAIVGGITEPLEFLFLFIAPPLYVFHAFMTGLSYMTLGLLGVTVGEAGDIIGFILYGPLQGLSNRWYLIIVVGLVWFAVYYIVFKWAILKYDLKTPGREDKTLSEGDVSTDISEMSNFTAKKMLDGLGGADNIVTIDNCFTRLRLELKDASIVQEDLIKEGGGISVVKLGDTTVQIIIGPQVQAMRKKIEKLMV